MYYSIVQYSFHIWKWYCPWFEIYILLVSCSQFTYVQRRRKHFMSEYSLVVSLLQHIHNETLYKSGWYTLPWQRAKAITVGRFEDRACYNHCMRYT